MKNIKTFKVLIIFAFIAFLYACSGPLSYYEQLVGTWKPVEVITDFDKKQFKEESLRSIKEAQMKFYFEFFEDSTMNLITPGGQTPALWYNDLEGNVFYSLEGSSQPYAKLGKLSSDTLIMIDETPVGKMVTKYLKD